MSKFKRFAQALLGDRLKGVEIASAFAWFHYVTTGKEVTIIELQEYFGGTDLAKFNPSRMRDELRGSPNVTKGSVGGSFRPAWKYMQSMESKFPFVVEKSEEVITDDTIIPDSLVAATRGYLISLAKQINASYNHNIFDGCAILMRRLLEILLIHSYETAGRVSDISESDGYKNLSYIIDFTLSNKPFILAKEVSGTLHEFRVLGNFSAHKISYNCRKKDIDNIRLKYRLAIEELLYRSGITK